MKSRRCKKAFTLVELLIVVAIIGMLSGLAIPKLYFTRNVYELRTKVTEIQSLIDQVNILAKNPAQGTTAYRLIVGGSFAVLENCNLQNCSAGDYKEVKRVAYGSGQSIVQGVNNLVYCSVPGNNCATTIAGSTSNLTADSTAVLMIMRSTKITPNRDITFTLRGAPYRLEVNGIP